ncbi:MAG: DegT/DnrJ/EryC1/StrS family aminotransferase, partial [Aeromicrobium sp.]|nr:DegT/DnrJ/EryC1/StrS family aminotransferase [Burkholderiales bacterium]
MKSRVAFFSAQLVNQSINSHAAIARVLDRYWYVMGDEVRNFETAFAAYCGVSHCIGVANGTDALELALRAVGVARGDSVVLAANAGYYGSAAVRLIGATPIYVDVDSLSLTLCPRSLAMALVGRETKPRAIIATHLYGQLSEIESIAMLARAHGVSLIEDCAQSHGASRNAKRAGSFGDIGCFSFYPTK